MFSHPAFTRAALLVSATAVAVTGLAGTAVARPGAPYLSYGSRGEGVKCVQIAVNWANAVPLDLAEDGVWGKQTQWGVIAFQNWKVGESQADGIVGPDTGDRMLETLREYNPVTANHCYKYLPSH